MKKTLIALAVLGLSGAAMAQSSVTFFGVADAGLGKIKSPGQRTPASSDDNNKTQFISASLMNNGDSRLGVNGTEDLGSGLKVGFTFETGLDLDEGGGANGQGSGAFWARQANVWISGSNWGTVKLGRQFTPSNLVTTVFELTPGNNYSVLGGTYRYVSLGTRANSAFAYVTPNFSGLTAALGYITKNDRADDKDIWDLGLMYANGPIAGGLSVNKVKDAKTGYQLGGRYNFGGHFSLVASYTQANNVLKGDPRAVRRGFELGGNATYGAFSVTLDLSRDTKNQWVATNKKYTNGLVELKYALSKRTFLYGAYLRLDGDNNYGIGIHHSF